MSLPSQSATEQARDSLYALLPAEIRTADAANGWPLKAYFGVLAEGSVEIDDEIDTLYDSMFVETAPAENLADLAALIGSELLRPLPAGSGYNERAYIAKTIHYRRGKGTARILEELGADVGGFGAIAVEYFMRLSRCQNLIDVRPERPGTALLVPGVTRSNAASAFDMLPRLADLRSIARAAGRHHVPNVGVHILRPVVPEFPAPPGTGLAPSKLAEVPIARSWPDGANDRAGYFQLAAQPGRVVRLFNPDRRSQDERPRVALTDLRAPLRRLALHLETKELRESLAEDRQAMLADPSWFDPEGRPFTIFMRRAGAQAFEPVSPGQILIANLDEAPAASARPEPMIEHDWFTPGKAAPKANSAELSIQCAFDPVTGRLIVAKPGAGADVEEVRIAYGTGIGRPIGAGPQERNDASVPFDILDTDTLTHFVRVVDAVAAETGGAADNVRTVNSLLTALTEWEASGAGKRGIVVLTRCDREGAAGSQTSIPVAIHQDCELHIVAARWVVPQPAPGLAVNPRRRGYLVRLERRFTIDSQLRVSADAPPASGPQTGALILDGLEVTGGVSLAVRALARLLVRHSTVRSPGGAAIATTAALNGVSVEIDRSILGRLALDFGTQKSTGSLIITDSIISSDEDADPAISASTLDAKLSNVTVLGLSSFKSLDATNVIFTEVATAVRRQSGCVRYSFLPDGSTMPRRFRCQPDLALAAAAQAKGSALSPSEADSARLGVTPLLLDTALDEPTVAMLSPLCSDAIRLGGENDSEMGVFSAVAEGLRRDNLITLFDDYVPVGLEAGVIDDTRSSAVALRRNRP